eukprot:4302184-Prymnesium_polylepis.1
MQAARTPRGMQAARTPPGHAGRACEGCQRLERPSGRRVLSGQPAAEASWNIARSSLGSATPDACAREGGRGRERAERGARGGERRVGRGSRVALR